MNFPQKNQLDMLDTSIIDQYIDKLDWQINNSNQTFSLQGLNNYISTQINEEYWLTQVYPKAISNAHSSGDMHIHQLNSLSVYCVGWNLEDLLKEGFCGVRGKLESRPPNHLRSALGQVADFLYTLQGESAGAQSFCHLDTLLAPFIYYDNISDEHLCQALQEFLFNMNVPTRVGFQTPFTNISFDVTVPDSFKDRPVIVGGKERDKTYKEFQREVDRFNSAFAAMMLKGDAKGRIFTFPIPTYRIGPNFTWDNPALENVWKLSAKYGIPYFYNESPQKHAEPLVNTTQTDPYTLHRRGGGFFGASPMTGSIGAVTINLPRIGYLANTQEEFFAKLKELMILAKESLEIKRKLSEEFTEHRLYPYTKYYLKNIKEKQGSYWANHVNSIGITGLNEAACNLLNTDITTQEGHLFATKVLDFMNEQLKEFQEQTHTLFNLEATPAESTSYRLAQKDIALFPDIKTASHDCSKQAFYTNASNLPVDFTDDMFEALTLQDPLQIRYSGGTALHFFLEKDVKDPNTIKSLVKKICSEYRLPYFTFTPTFSVCPTHGYLSGQQEICPTCQTPCEIYSRIVGYIRPIELWNEGKKKEFALRKNFNV